MTLIASEATRPGERERAARTTSEGARPAHLGRRDAAPPAHPDIRGPVRRLCLGPGAKLPLRSFKRPSVVAACLLF